MSIINGFIQSTDIFSGELSSSNSSWGITTKGDTLRIVNKRNPNSNGAGEVGEICFGTSGGVSYLYYCVATNTWERVALATY